MGMRSWNSALACGRADAGGVDQIFHGQGNAMQRTAPITAGDFRFGVAGLLESGIGGNRDEGMDGGIELRRCEPDNVLSAQPETATACGTVRRVRGSSCANHVLFSNPRVAKLLLVSPRKRAESHRCLPNRSRRGLKIYHGTTITKRITALDDRESTVASVSAASRFSGREFFAEESPGWRDNPPRPVIITSFPNHDYYFLTA